MGESELKIPGEEPSERPPCPRFGSLLTLMVEPEALQFYCPEDDQVYEVAQIVAQEAARAKAALHEALVLWQARMEEIGEMAEAARTNHEAALTEMHQRRFAVAAERIRTLQQSLSRLA